MPRPMPGWFGMLVSGSQSAEAGAALLRCGTGSTLRGCHA